MNPATDVKAGREVPARARSGTRWAIVLALPLVVLLAPRPADITPQAWHLLAVFAGTILGVIVQPIPIAAIALLGIVTAAFTGAMTPAQALGGYADPLVWMVFSAFCAAGAMIKTGLGRRLALLFIRSVGGTSIGLAYSLIGSDVVLGTVIPSNGARAAGILFPIVKSLAEAFDSRPGPTAGRLGAFLMVAVYHCDMTVSAMFFTGQASNPLIAQLAGQVTGIDVGYARWAAGAIVPAVVSMLAIPFLLLWLMPPAIRRTPAATRLASDELARLGPPARGEKVMIGVFALLMALWMTRSWHGIDYPVVALAGLAILLVTRVLEWNDVLNERSAWDTLVWYGALFQMARVLGDTGVIEVFARFTSGLTAGSPWGIALIALVVVYVYAHYAFASITAHVSAMYVPFLVVVLGAGTPPLLALLSLAYLSSVGASLTQYGTTPGPVYFGAGYLTEAQWWRVGLIVTTVNLLVWMIVGSIWWKVLGWW
jgi:DASS family divalent anion:Na+ symporter